MMVALWSLHRGHFAGCICLNSIRTSGGMISIRLYRSYIILTETLKMRDIHRTFALSVAGRSGFGIPSDGANQAAISSQQTVGQQGNK